MGAFADIDFKVPFHACETVSGRYVDIVNPDPGSIVLSDIAWSLSRQARFAGHTISREVWNVAQHSLFVFAILQCGFIDSFDLQKSLDAWLDKSGHEKSNVNLQALNVAALMHDATEAYLVDLPSPVKRHEALREPYKALEHTMESAIWTAFDFPLLTPTETRIIVWADLVALQIEAAHLMPSRGRGWAGDLPEVSHYDLGLFPTVMNSADSYHAFLKTAESIGICSKF